MATATFRVEDFAAELGALEIEFVPHETDYLDEGRLETEAIHDLENTGETTARFTTVELLA